MSKNNKALLQKELEKTFDKVIGLIDTKTAESIEVSANYLVYVEVAKDLVYLSLEKKRSDKKIHSLYIGVSPELDVFFEGAVFRKESSLPASSREHVAQYATKGTPQFTRGFEILVESISTDFQVACFLSALEGFV